MKISKNMSEGLTMVGVALACVGLIQQSPGFPWSDGVLSVGALVLAGMGVFQTFSKDD
jgi:hypothetical protein